jgi:peroxiredoxin
MNERLDTPLPDDWDKIPGAKVCTPQSCSFRDLSEEFRKLNTTVYDLSTQSKPCQIGSAE